MWQIFTFASPSPVPPTKLNEAAFETDAEADLVEGLRGSGVSLVSLVAETDGEIIGHILFSPVWLNDDASLNVMGLGPMAVVPNRQRKGVGSALLRQGLICCKDLGARAVVVIGHPEYYPRFGFVPSTRWNIRCEYEVPPEAFMAIELKAGYLEGKAGMIRYHPAFAEV